MMYDTFEEKFARDVEHSVDASRRPLTPDFTEWSDLIARFGGLRLKMGFIE